MAPQPIVFISHFRVKSDRTADVRAMATAVSAQLAAAKPGTAAFLPYLAEDGTTFTIVHVFPDPDAMAAHFAGADQRSAAAYEIIEPAGWEVHGEPHPEVLAGLRTQADAAGITIAVEREALGGFLRTPKP